MMHYKTTNESFIKLAYIFKEMGIQNFDFFLQLNNPLLEHVDPLDEKNLTFEQKIMIQQEIRNNIWYFFRECIVIPTGGGDVRFEATRLTVAIIWSLQNNLKIIIESCRQAFKTSTLMYYYLWLLYYSKNTQMLMFAMKEGLLKSNMNRLKEVRNNLPKYLQYSNKKDIDNTSSIRFNMDNGSFNSLSYVVGGQSESAASNAGRGMSAQCLLFDEAAFINHIEMVYNTVIYSYSTVAKVAENNNSPHHIVLSTTAGFLDNPSGLFVYNMIQRSIKFNERLYDICYFDTATKSYKTDQVKLKKSLRSNGSARSTNSFVSIKFHYYEIGKHDGYLEEQRENSTSDEDFRREVLINWNKISSSHPLGTEMITELQKRSRKPNNVLVIDDLYFLNIYRDNHDIEWEFPYVIGMDVGSNTGSDFSAIVIIDPKNNEVVATMRSNNYTLPKFMKAVEYILFKLFPNSILVLERNGVGSMVAQLFDKSLPRNRMFREGEKAGLNNNKTLRDILYNEVLRSSVISGIDRIHDSYIIDEMVTLQFKNGRIDHAKDSHDDTLMAFLFAKWFINYYNHADKSTYIDPILINCEMSRKLDILEKRRLEKTMNNKFSNIFKNRTNYSDMTQQEKNKEQEEDILNKLNMLDSPYSTMNFMNDENYINNVFDDKEKEKELENVTSYYIDDKDDYKDDEIYGKSPEVLLDKLQDDKQYNLAKYNNNMNKNVRGYVVNNENYEDDMNYKELNNKYNESEEDRPIVRSRYSSSFKTSFF